VEVLALPAELFGEDVLPEFTLSLPLYWMYFLNRQLCNTFVCLDGVFFIRIFP
jgi:hypothetical protein